LKKGIGGEKGGGKNARKRAPRNEGRDNVGGGGLCGGDKSRIKTGLGQLKSCPGFRLELRKMKGGVNLEEVASYSYNRWKSLDRVRRKNGRGFQGN